MHDLICSVRIKSDGIGLSILVERFDQHRTVEHQISPNGLPGSRNHRVLNRRAVVGWRTNLVGNRRDTDHQIAPSTTHTIDVEVGVPF